MNISDQLKKPYFLMFMGIAVSFCCSSLINGAIPTFVAIGLLPTSWIPILTTTVGVLSVFGLIIARLIENRNPYRIIMACNLYDCGLSLLVIVIATQHLFAIHTVLCGYLILISVTPIVTSISQQVYSGELSIASPSESSLFNTLAFSFTPFMSLALSSTAGSLLASQSLTTIITANIVLSGVSFLFSYNAYRLNQLIHHEPGKETTASKDKVRVKNKLAYSDLSTLFKQGKFFRKHTLSDVFIISAHSPFMIGMLYLTIDIYLLYLPVWLSHHARHKSHVVALINFCAGIGSACGPILYHRWRLKVSYKSHVVRSIGIIALAEVIMLLAILSGHSMNGFLIALFALMVLLISFMSAYSSMASMGARQNVFANDRYSLIVGMSYSCLSLAIIAGSWIGYYLSAAQSPGVSIALSLVFGIMLLIAVKRRPSPSHQVSLSSSQHSST